MIALAGGAKGRGRAADEAPRTAKQDPALHDERRGRGLSLGNQRVRRQDRDPDTRGATQEGRPCA